MQAFPASKTQIEIAYDGLAVKGGSMNVMDLAPALFALGSLFERANAIVYGGTTTATVNVKATRGGSFIVLLDIHQSLLQQATQWLFQDGIKDATELVAAVVALFKLLKAFKGKPPSTVSVQGENVVISSGDVTQTISKTEYNFYSDGYSRRAAAEVVKPLRRPDMDTFEVRKDEQVLDTTDKAEATYFDLNVDDVQP